MYLKLLEMSGFKSFAEARIEFPRGITTVVGPNGTGKSNIVDAILWVLGEQSTKTLRSERMEDVIFNGTESRKPLGMSEVSLILAGVGHEKLTGIQGLPDPLKEYSEVMISRRLYRDGASEYLINKIPCRLKDIRTVLLETRAGIKGHTVIEQGRIDQILNASPQERRELIEETAGIVRYKKQKAEALRKLDATQQNLVRVRDVITEVRRQLNSLERQARQARAYQRHHEEAKALEIRLLLRDARRLLRLQAEVGTDLATLEDREAAEAAEESALTSGIEETRLRMTAGQETLDRIREDLAAVEQEQNQALTAVEVERSRSAMYEQQRAQSADDRHRLNLEEQRADGTLAEVRERMARMEAEAAEAGRELAELESAGEALQERRSGLSAMEDQARRDILEIAVKVPALESQLARMQARQEELGKQGERLQTERGEVARELEEASELRRHAADAQSEGERQAQELRRILTEREAECRRLEHEEQAAGEDVTGLQGALAAAESRLGALEGVIREEMGYGRVGEEESTSLRACDGVREAVAEWLTVPSGLERAVDAVLGERGRAWLVENPSRARQALELLDEKRLGRGSFIPMQPRWAWSSGDARDHVKAGAGVLGWALDVVPAREGAEHALRCLFEDVLLVESLDVALRVWEQGMGEAGRGVRIVTLAGEVLDAAGVLTGGQHEGSGGLLQRRKEVQDLAAQREDLREELDRAKERRGDLRGRVESLRADVQACEEEIRGAEMRVLTAAKDAEGLDARLDELSRRLEHLGTEADRAGQERARLEADAGTAGRDVEQVRQEKAVREAALAELTATISVVEEKHLAMQQQLTEARLSAGSVHAKLEHDQLELSRLLREQQDRTVRLKSLELRIGELAAAEEQSRAEQARNEAIVRDLGARADRIRADYVSAQEAQTELHQKARQSEALLGGVRKRLAASREARLAVEVRRAELNTQLQTVESTLSGTYELALENGLAQEPHEKERRLQSEEGRSEEEVTQALREELQGLRGKLERMGPINLAAIEEHDALEERHRFLTSQQEDLSNSIKSLNEIIQRINRTTQRMFIETFNELQEKFGEVFSRLFPGGRAELVLVEPETPLTEEEPSAREPGVDIVAQPPGKRLKTITMLSGGEKSLTAMALLFASFLIRPTPFCILDEIDAPLDEENVGRFADVLRELSSRAQFIVITHNKRTMTVADSLFGVTMEEPGVSQLISIRLADLQPA